MNLRDLEYLVPLSPTLDDKLQGSPVKDTVTLCVRYRFPGEYVCSNSEQAHANGAAIRVMKALNLGRTPSKRVYGADIVLARESLDLVDLYADVSAPMQLVHDQAIDMVLDIIQNNLLESPVQGLSAYEASLPEIRGALERYISHQNQEDFEKDDALHLKMQRALIVSAELAYLETIKYTRDVLETCSYQTSDDYLKAMNSSISESGRYEKESFKLMLSKFNISLKPNVSSIDATQSHHSKSGMRLGLSSANASDNYTYSFMEEEGGYVLNGAILLKGADGSASGVSCIVDFPARQSEDACIILESDDNISPPGLKACRLSKSDSFSIDATDHFRLFKSALIFSGFVEVQQETFKPCAPLQKIFDSERSLRIRVRNNGPSRSGFASSSAISLNLLAALYKASNQTQNLERKVLATLTWVFENELGLRSGRQDIDGTILPALNYLHYQPRTKFLFPTVKPIDIPNLADFYSNLYLVDTGIPRTAHLDLRRGLNIRHLAYLTRSPKPFVAMKKSIGIHQVIVEAFQTQNWAHLGKLMLEYMALREEIDPTALVSHFDSSFGKPILRDVFDMLLAKDLIYGGMLSGAMGGGVMILVLTEKGKLKVDQELERIRTGYHTAAGLKGPSPFERLKKIDFEVDTQGLQTWSDCAE